MIHVRAFATMTCLAVLLLLPACAKTSKNRVAANDSTVGHERVQSQDLAAGKSYPSAQRTEGPVTSTSPMACVSHRDSRGRMVYDDPACKDQYRRQQLEVAAVCRSFADVDEKRLAEDPGYSDRTRTTRTSEDVSQPGHRNNSVNTAFNNVLQAEVAGNQGNIPEMLRLTRMSLDSIDASPNAGTNAYLTSAARDLRETMIVGCRNKIAPAALSDARMKLSRTAVGRETPEALKTSSRLTSQTVRGELVRDTTSSGAMGGEHFVVRDRENREIPIRLSPEMSDRVQPGDMVEAQLDSSGEVVAISKAQ